MFQDLSTFTRAFMLISQLDWSKDGWMNLLEEQEKGSYLNFIDLIGFAFAIQCRSKIASTGLNTSTEMMRQRHFETLQTIESKSRRENDDPLNQVQLTSCSIPMISPWISRHSRSHHTIAVSSPGCSTQMINSQICVRNHQESLVLHQLN